MTSVVCFLWQTVGQTRMLHNSFSHMLHNLTSITSTLYSDSKYFISVYCQSSLCVKRDVYIYCLFSRVIDGFETLDAMEKVPVGKKNRPLADIRLERVTIHANPLAVN